MKKFTKEELQKEFKKTRRRQYVALLFIPVLAILWDGTINPVWMIAAVLWLMIMVIYVLKTITIQKMLSESHS